MVRRCIAREFTCFFFFLFFFSSTFSYASSSSFSWKNGPLRTMRTWWSHSWLGPGTVRTKSSFKSGRKKTRSSKIHRSADFRPLLQRFRNNVNLLLTLNKNSLHCLLQNFYLWKKDKKALKEIKNKDKELLIQVIMSSQSVVWASYLFFFFYYSKVFHFLFFLQENFCGTSIIVPDLEAVLHLKEDGKKSWKPRLFQLRASGIYYVPKGKSKVRGQSTSTCHPSIF